jgi:hypothetical protein
LLRVVLQVVAITAVVAVQADIKQLVIFLYP